MHNPQRPRLFFTADLEVSYFYQPKEHIWQNEYEPPQVEFIYILDTITGDDITESTSPKTRQYLTQEIITYENYYENLTTHRCIDVDF